MTTTAGPSSFDRFFLHHSLTLGVPLVAVAAVLLVTFGTVRASGYRVSRRVAVPANVVTGLVLVVLSVDIVGRYLAFR